MVYCFENKHFFRGERELRYENEICAGCGNPLVEGEDIVVCPECATPQHRECWNKTNSCVNGYLHASGYVWQAEGKAQASDEKKEEEQDVICPNCAAPNDSKALHCSHCGSPLGGNQQGQPFPGIPFQLHQPSQRDREMSLLYGTGCDPDEGIGGERAGDIAIYVRRNQHRFIPRFKRCASGKKINWNWAAFFLSPYWFFYRKIYKVGLVFMGILLGLNLLASPQIDKELEDYYNYTLTYAQMLESGDVSIEEQEEAAEKMMQLTREAAMRCVKNPWIVSCFAGMLLLNVAAALVADNIYFKRVTGDIKKLRDTYREGELYKTMVYRVGGASPLAFIASYFGMSAVFDMIIMLIQGF